MEIKPYAAYDEAEIARLYADAGWTAYTRGLPALREGFARSLCVLAAYEDGELLGLLRAVGDGATIVYIQDILVFREHRRRGVGTALLQSALEQYGHVRQIVLITDDTPETTAFYRAAGFRELAEAGCRGFMRFR